MSYNNQEDILYNNKFIIDDSVEDIDQDKLVQFQEYIEKKREKDHRKLLTDQLEKELDPNLDQNDLLNTSGFIDSNKDKFLSLGIQQTIPSGMLPLYLQNGSNGNKGSNGNYGNGGDKIKIGSGENGVKRERRTVVNIDSRDRDTEEYPNANSFKIRLDRAFLNIKSITLLSTEFPNADQPIKRSPSVLQNNKMVWLNEEDKDFSLTPEFPEYSVEITPGNYTSKSLAKEMTTKMNSIKRSTVSGTNTGKNHFFDISIDLDTDIVEIHQLELTNLLNNPISTNLNSQTITVQQLDHSFSVGDKAYLTGVRGFIGGISPTTFNDFHIVTATTSNIGNGSFGPILITELNNIIDFTEGTTSRIAVVGKAVFDNPTELASNVAVALNNAGDYNYTVDFNITSANKFTINANSTFELNWLTGTNSGISIGETLGYTVSADDTGSNSYIADTFVPNSTWQFELKVDGVFTDTGGNNGVRSGSLLPYKFIFGSDTATLGPLLGYPAEDSSSDILTPNTSQLTTFFNNIVSASIVTGPPRSLNINSPSHGLSTGDYIQLYDLITTPSIASTLEYTSSSRVPIFQITVTDSNNFTLPFPDITAVNPDLGTPSWGSSRMNVAHTGHGLSTGDKIRLYRAETIGGIKKININNKPFTITTVDVDNYYIDITNNFATKAETGGGSYLRVSANNVGSTLYGFAGLQDNTSDGTNLNREINLNGEDYVFLVSPQLKTLGNSNKLVPDIFAKILLTGVPGTRLYNTFVSNPKTFDDAPLNELEFLEFQLKRQDNNLFDLNGLDYSFSLEIVEFIDEIRNSSFSSRRGVRELVNSSNNPFNQQNTNSF